MKEYLDSFLSTDYRISINILKRLAIITSHPIQYNAPLFKLLTERNKIQSKVFYTWGDEVLHEKYDPGFGKVIEWDVPLLDGYEYTFVNNTSKNPGSHHFNGIRNPALIKEIENWQADALLVFGWSFSSHLQAIRYFHKRKPVYFRGDSTLLDQQNGVIKKLSKKILLKWVYSHVDKAFYVGSPNKAYFESYGLDGSRLVFAPHAVDNDRFGAHGNRDFRQSLAIPPGGTVFLFTGKLEEKKDPGLLLEAFIKLDNPDTYLLLVGNGHLERKLRQQASEASVSIQRRIHLVDFQNQSFMPGIYKSADVLVLPSRGPGETWGLSVNEAMASGLAVIVSDKCGCFADLVQDGANGYVFESGNVGALADRMKKILPGKNRIIEMGKASQEIIKNWSFTNICLAIENEMTYI